MNANDNFDNLEQSISEIHCSTRPELDEQILGDAFAGLDEAMQSKPSALQIIFKSKITKLAIAIIIIIAAIIGAKLLFITPAEMPPKEIAKRNDTTLPQSFVPEEQKIEQDLQTKPVTENIKTKLNTELKQIMDMFAANNIDGLVSALSDRRREIKLAAAIYLAKIGDERASEMLRKLSSESSDEELANMFSITASLIQKRLEEEKAQQKVALVQEAVLSGFITDIETGEAVIDANIAISSEKNYTTTTDENGFYYFENAVDDGNYRIKITSKEYVGITEQEKYPVVYLSKDSQVIKHFRLEKACMIDLLVIDEVNEPVSNVRIFITKPAEKNKIIDTGSGQMTDEKGLLLLGGLRRGTFNLTAIHKITNESTDIVETLTNFAPERITIKLENPNVIEYREIILKKGAEIQGQVQFTDGSSEDNLIISVQPVWWDLPFKAQNYTTDYDGKFKLENITDGTYQIKLKTKDDNNDIFSFQAELPPKDEFFIITVPQDMNIPDTNIPDVNIADTNIPDMNIPDVNIADSNISDSNAEPPDF